MNRNLQPAIHPDADQLSVFVEGAATARERERMLAHLAECGECRKAVFLMQAHEEPQPAAMTPEKRWAWPRWVVPVGVPAAALACALLAVLLFVRSHGTPETPQQVASARPPEAARPETTVAPNTNAEADRATPSPVLEPGAPTDKRGQAPAADSELVARSGGAPSAPAKKVLQQESPIAGRPNLPASNSEQATAGVPPPTPGAPPAAVGGPVGPVQTADSSLANSAVSTTAKSNLPANGRNITALQQLQPADTKGAATQNTLAKQKEVPVLQIQGASSGYEALAGISGHITDRSGAVIAGATVTVRDAAGKTRQTTTGTDGSFHLTQLPAGQYALTAAAKGFSTSQQSIELKPSEMAMLQPMLDVGAVSETVEVEAGATSIQAESTDVGGQAVTGRRGTPPSDLPLLATVSLGKRLLSLDNAGNLFLSRDEGKKWKKIKPQWAGKVVRIESTTAAGGEASANAKDEISGAGEVTAFQLTTDAGTTWSSKDGLHWHQR